MGKYQALAAFIIENMGGKGNISNLTYCMTRLRFNLKNDSLVNEKELQASPEIVTMQKAGGKYQVVIGTHVGDVYKEIAAQAGLEGGGQEDVGVKGGFLNRLIDIITKSVTPVLGVLIASGIIQGLLALLVALKLVTPGDGTHVILNAMGQALFQFFPIILGFTSANAFGMNPFVGMILGGSLVFPGIVQGLAAGDVLYTLFGGTIFEMGVYKTLFGIPILFPPMGYGATVIPILFATFFASKVERALKKGIPDIVGFTLVPFLTMLVSVPVTILLIGPISNILSLIISAGVTSLYNISPILTALVVALVYQPLVILGLHWPLITIAINNMGIMGADYILPMIYTASFAQTAVVLAVYLRTKSAKTKGICVPAMISGLFCIIEPAIYGITLPVKKRFAFSMVGGAVGAVILSAFSVKMYAIAVGVLGIVGFLNPDGSTSGLVMGVIATLAAMAVSFLLTFFTFKEDEQNPPAGSAPRPERLPSPLKGEARPLSDAHDATFAGGTLGKGILVLPSAGKVIAPCDGVLTAFFRTGHALSITSDSGTEILIHVGENTVQLEGKYFVKKKAQGDRVRAGEVLLEFDMQAIKDAGFNLETPVIITNSGDYLDVIEAASGEVDYLAPLLTVVPFGKTAAVKAV